MQPYYEDTESGIVLYHGDCRDILPSIEVQATALVTDPPAGIAFMGKTWDHDHGGRAGWVKAFAETFAVVRAALLPGAPGLVWALPRTSHWTACALEDAGFELRDTLCHTFGSGFPKSHNIGKAIDREAGAEREVIGIAKGAGMSAKQPDVGTFRDDNWIPIGSNLPITTPATPEAATWEGYGTALAPGYEHWHLVMNPREGTFAGNCLEHGTGALNIDGCRVASNNLDGANRIHGGKSYPGVNEGFQGNRKKSMYRDKTDWHPSQSGRWPSNIVFTHSAACEPGRCAGDCPVAELDRQSGVLTSGDLTGQPRPDAKNVYSSAGATKGNARYHKGDTGGASRYFKTFYYHSKASKADRGPGNRHPTVKATGLMRWLLTLVRQPQRNMILDPFGGSGSTAVACKQLGLPCVVITDKEEHCEIAARRIQATQPILFAEVRITEAPPPPEQPSLF